MHTYLYNKKRGREEKKSREKKKNDKKKVRGSTLILFLREGSECMYCRVSTLLDEENRERKMNAPL